MIPQAGGVKISIDLYLLGECSKAIFTWSRLPFIRQIVMNIEIKARKNRPLQCPIVQKNKKQIWKPYSSSAFGDNGPKPSRGGEARSDLGPERVHDQVWPGVTSFEQVNVSVLTVEHGMSSCDQQWPGVTSSDQVLDQFSIDGSTPGSLWPGVTSSD